MSCRVVRSNQVRVGGTVAGRARSGGAGGSSSGRVASERGRRIETVGAAIARGAVLHRVSEA